MNRIEMNDLTWRNWDEWIDMGKLACRKWNEGSEYEGLDMNELNRMNWHEWIGMKDLKWRTWNEAFDMNELRWMNWGEWLTWMNSDEQMRKMIEMKDLTWMNWNECFTWMNWNEGFEISELERTNWNEWFDMNELEGMNRQMCSEPLSCLTILLWKRALATVSCTFCSQWSGVVRFLTILCDHVWLAYDISIELSLIPSHPFPLLRNLPQIL